MRKIRKPGRALAFAAAAPLLAGALVITASTSSAAVQDTFELDGNVLDASGAPPDWDAIFTAGGQTGPSYLPAPTAKTTLPEGFVSGSFFRDFTPGSTGDATTFATGSKDTLDIDTGWQCKASNNVTDKGDIQNTYMTPFRDTNGDLIVYAGLEKNAPNGNNNMAVWLLKDGSVGCTAGGGNTDFQGEHQDGDLLLVAAFLNGGSNPVINAYEWSNGALGTTALSTGGKCGTAGSANLCAITNDTSNVTTPWITSDKSLGTAKALQADQFYEMGANLTQLGVDECFANYMANTRSSQELGATLYDFAGGSAPTCGSLKVKKYIDVNTDGDNNTGDITTGTAVAGWSFRIQGPGGLDCTGLTTSTAGEVVAVNCSASASTADKARTVLGNMPPGSYTITETQKSGFVNSEPGPYPNTGTTVSQTITLTTAGATVEFGNGCRIVKPFRVTNVPAGTTTMFARYTVTTDVPGTTTSGNVTLTDQGGGVWTGDTAAIFDIGDVISWTYGPTLADQASAGTHTFVVGEGYSTCRAGVNTVAYAPGSITGFKYKDMDGDGVTDTADLTKPLEGWEFLITGPGHASGTKVYSDGTGKFTLTGLAAGSYTVKETGLLKNSSGTPVAATNWQRTRPALTDTQNVSITLASGSGTVPTEFLNAPLSDLKVGFTDLTGSTDVKITCKDVSGATVYTKDTNGSSLETFTDTLAGIKLSQSKLTCDFEVTDP